LPPIANADVARIAKIDTLNASKLLAGWREQCLLMPLPGRGKRNRAYAKPAQGAENGSLLSVLEENNGDPRE
jgi:ATP-dependent DNA helicase RecG